MTDNGQNNAIRRLITQPMWLPVLVSIILLSGSMALLTLLIYNGLQRFDPLYEHAQQTARLHREEQRIASLDNLPATQTTARRLITLAHWGGWLAVDSRAHLLEAGRMLKKQGLAAGPQVIDLLRATITAEDAASLRRFSHVHTDARHALQLALITLIAFPFIVIAFLSGLHGRLVAPLDHLALLLSRLAGRSYEPLESEGVTPTLRPLFASYNRLVNRLQTLEQAHANRERELSATVTDATRSLMLTQSALGRAERMAAAGEVAASLAHDLRNPLAGIRLALHNLESETDSPDTAERLHLVGEEIDRLVGALNAQLARVRHHPEPPTPVKVIDTLHAVVRLQQLRHEGGYRVHIDAPQELRCELPEVGFRLALQNLIANACEAVVVKGGEVRVQAGRVAGELRIRIDDDGPGFPAVLLAQGPRAFSSDKADGIGLGLASARRFAHENHGRLKLSNRPSGGASALLVLPCPTPKKRTES